MLILLVLHGYIVLNKIPGLSPFFLDDFSDPIKTGLPIVITIAPIVSRLYVKNTNNNLTFKLHFLRPASDFPSSVEWNYASVKLIHTKSMVIKRDFTLRLIYKNIIGQALEVITERRSEISNPVLHTPIYLFTIFIYL